MAGIGVALRGFGKVLKNITKEARDQKEMLKKASPKYGGPATDPDTIKLNKQIKTGKKIAGGAVGAVGAAAVHGKIKENKKKKEKKKKK